MRKLEDDDDLGIEMIPMALDNRFPPSFVINKREVYRVCIQGDWLKNIYSIRLWMNGWMDGWMDG